MTTGFRTLFLAREATWDGWLEALGNNRVAAVRRDELTGHRLTMHAGSEAVRRFVLDREAEWRWWDNPRRHRPPASLAVLRPEDRFEAGRPEAGVNLRLRCAWTNTPHGLLVDPLAEFVELTLDGRPVAPEHVRERAPKGTRFVDSYHLWQMPTPESGDHVAAATVKDLRTGARSTITAAFRG